MSDIYHRLPAVKKITGLARTTIYELIKTGEFPKPIQISHRGVAWSEIELVDWQENKKAARSNNP
ncbi:MAG: AlpA family transcriptional regulator [Gammaproteobacteria bacterium]|nr:AlpA family transcriptional regulator [Gammaproteobacteria bacterium]